MSGQLPSEMVFGATLRGKEYGWTLNSFPVALAAADRLKLACLGGQFQFRVGDAVYEPYWISADSSERRSGETWADYVHRSCGEVAESFQQALRTTDFGAVARQWPDLGAKAEDVLNTLVFVAYFVTEQEHYSLSALHE
jgi:hypothetical protein